MAKILFKGRDPAKSIYDYECTVCDSLIRFDHTDIDEQEDGDYVCCPVCKACIAWENVKKRGQKVSPSDLG